MVIGWDIGGVNTKVAIVEAGRILAVREEPFELQRAPHALSLLLRRLVSDAEAPAGVVHAVTMTAELSQFFRTKREGVAYVLDAVEHAFPASPIRVFTVAGEFVTTIEARAQPLRVAAANWMATALLVGAASPDCVLVDTGTTTTDIIPIAGGRVVARGATDLERLTSGELLYTGVVRTPVEAVVAHVTVRGARVAVSAEGFALTGDVHVWRGPLSPADYDAPTPDRRPAERAFAGERLRRLVCADAEMLGEDDVSAIAESVAEAQIEQVAAGIRAAVARHPMLTSAVVTGRGAFLAAEAACRAGLDVQRLSSHVGGDAARSAPAVAVATLCEHEMSHVGLALPKAKGLDTGLPGSRARVDVVLKIGGGSLQSPGDLEAALAVIDAVPARSVLVVPGGGPFADAVRDVSGRMALSDDTAHWMAVRAMDVVAELLVSRLRRGVLVRSAGEVDSALTAGQIPVLAPYQWLREADPLPHSWDVTSDSIAAWFARVTGAAQVVLVKPRGARGPGLTDAFFTSTVGDTLGATALGVDQLEALAALLQVGPL